MPTRDVNIGLSLGADICWPIAYETLFKQLDLNGMKVGRNTLNFDVERVTIEPYSLHQPVKYDVVIDRLTHWYNTSREWIKKAILVDGLYVYNNPWSLQSNEKHTSYAAMTALGLSVPETWMLPPKAYEGDDPDRDVTLKNYARMFSLNEVGEKIGYPFFMKPYHGGGWRGVTKIDNAEDLHRAYDESGTEVMNLQKAVIPHEYFVRCVGLGPQTRKVNYAPGAPLHDRYQMDINFLSEEDQQTLEDITMTINAFFGWDFNSCESLKADGIWHPIDFANACPDSQVTSLHYHFPWLIKANLRWSLFCAATDRPMRKNMDWAPFYKIAEKDIDPREKLSEYAAIAHKRFETEKFRKFCQKNLGHLDELAYDFFGSDVMRDAINKKVTALFPAHEVDEFTELFWNRVQLWREQEGQHGDKDGF